MNADSVSKSLERAQQDRQQAQTNEFQKILETLKNDFQHSLLAESQSFKNSFAATERRFKRLALMALVMTVLTVLCSSALLLASLLTTRQMNRQAQALCKQMEIADPYATLRQQKLFPVGQPVTIDEGRIFIELKTTD